MNSQFVSVLQPIALRQSSDGEHPLQALKTFSQTPKAEATAVATQLCEIFASIKTFLSDKYLPMLSEQRANRTQSPDAPLRPSEVQRNAFFSLIDNLCELKRILAESLATRAIPELKQLEEELRRTSMTVRVGHLDLSPREAVRHLEQIALKCQQVLDETTRNVADGINSALTTLPVKESGRLAAIIDGLLTCRDLSGVVDEHAKLPVLLKNWRDSISRESQSYRFIDELVRKSNILHTYSKCAHTNEQQSTVTDRQINKLFGDVVTLILGETHFRTMLYFSDTLKNPFIKASIRVAIAPQLDPTPKEPITYDITRRLPESLRTAAKGLGVSANGDLVAVSGDGNRAALAEALANLLDTKDTSIFNGTKLRKHLAPVVRAAVKEARDVITLREAEEELRVKQARESLEYATLFFSVELGESLPRDVSAQNELLTRFVAKYTEPHQIDARTQAIKTVAENLPIPGDDLAKHYSLYLLSEKEFGYWSSQTDKLKTLVLRSFRSDGSSSLILNDPSSYLPTALSQMIQALQESGAPVTPKE